MGWTSYRAMYYKNNNTVDRKAECDYIIGREPMQELVKSVMVGRVWYAAILDTKSGKVWGAVFLTNVDGDEFAYTDMDETVGPCYYDCPNNILNLLSPTDNKWANEWREKCRENNARKHSPKAFGKLHEGQRVMYTVPDDKFMNLNKGDKVCMVKAKVNGMKRCVWLIPYMGYVSPKYIDMDDYELID